MKNTWCPRDCVFCIDIYFTFRTNQIKRQKIYFAIDWGKRNQMRKLEEHFKWMITLNVLKNSKDWNDLVKHNNNSWTQESTVQKFSLYGHKLGFHPQTSYTRTTSVQHNKHYHRKVLLSSFHLNDHIIGFHPQTQKLEPPCTA